MDPKVRALVAKIQKKHPGSILLGSEIVAPLRPTITCGSLNLDAALGGGWATGHWNEILGHESSGKTYLVLKTIAANQKLDPKFFTVWFATEDYNETYAAMLGVDNERVLVINEVLMEVVYQHAIDFLKLDKVDLIVIDSLPFLVSDREDTGDMDASQPGQSAFMTGKFFRKSQGNIKRNLGVADERLCTGLVINGWREKIGVTKGDPRVAPGGKGKNFVFYQRVDVSRREWIKNSRDRPVGQTMQLKNIKNKYARPGLIGTVDAYVVDYREHKSGSFDLAKDLITAGRAYNVITKPDRSHYTFGGETWYGEPNMIEGILGDEKLMVELRRQVIAQSVAPMDEEDDNDEDDEPAPPPAKKAAAKKRPAKKTVHLHRQVIDTAPAKKKVVKKKAAARAK